jgi:CBS-domain-containing membrane protein
LREVPEHMRTTLTAAEIATPMERVVTARPDDLVVDLLARFTVGSGRRALVIDDGALVGIVTASDVERALEMADVAGAGGSGAAARVVVPPGDRG